MSRIFANLNHIRDVQRRRRFRFGIVGVILFFLLLFFIYLFIARSGYWLVQDDPFDHVSWVAILDGQTADLERSDFALKLLQGGKVDSVLILGRRVYRDKSSADYYAEDFARSGDIDSSRVFLLHHDDPSTMEEAFSIIPWFKSKNADTVLLITSASATARAKRIFSKLAGDTPVFLTVDINHFRYNGKNWFFDREMRKTWLREWLAMFNSYWDLCSIDVIELDTLRLPNIRSLKEDRVSLPKVEQTKWVSIKEAFLKDVKPDSLIKSDTTILKKERKEVKDSLKPKK